MYMYYQNLCRPHPPSLVCVFYMHLPLPLLNPNLPPFPLLTSTLLLSEKSGCFSLTCVLFQHSEALASVVRSLTSLTQKDSPLDALEEVEWSIVWPGGYKAWRVQTQCSNSYYVLKLILCTPNIYPISKFHIYLCMSTSMNFEA